MSFNDLLVLKKSRKKPKEGDVFVLKPRSDLYCYGKVIEIEVKSKDSFVNGMYLIYIYDYFSKTKEYKVEFDAEKLLIPPMVVNTQLWIKGFAETFSNIEVLDKEKNIEYGFWDIGRKIYVNINGDKIDNIPQFASPFGLGSYGVVGKEIQKTIKARNI
ncbi:Immunity protein 26 [Eubacterium ruminantium]|nr:Immunity protein 26 [Eubacterium ruminantium]